MQNEPQHRIDFINRFVKSEGIDDAWIEADFEQVLDWVDEQLTTARAEGAKAMRDYIILAGVEIDGKDYVPLDGILRRSKTLLQALTTKEIDHAKE